MDCHRAFVFFVKSCNRVDILKFGIILIYNTIKHCFGDTHKVISKRRWAAGIKDESSARGCEESETEEP